MPEIAALALAWLSYSALHAAAPERAPQGAIARSQWWPAAMRSSSLVLFAVAVRVASDDLVTGVLIASVAWMLAASVLPIVASLAMRSRPVMIALALAVAAFGCLHA